MPFPFPFAPPTPIPLNTLFTPSGASDEVRLGLTNPCASFDCGTGENPDADCGVGGWTATDGAFERVEVCVWRVASPF